MARLGSVSLVLALLPAAGWAQPSGMIGPVLQDSSRLPEQQHPPRSFVLQRNVWPELPDRVQITAEIAPNTRAAVGMFGWKLDEHRQAPVTGRDFASPKSRRAGVGISLKF